ncbi:FtsQ-type POTRA domain-containing protein [Ruminococcaceae bacterium OttesenSCG-928-I18]|nr:FtsQ-type POTRA domain-containing protein [Ruminococcaceae bacterium OttesenSCG-928-I18]
MKGVALLPKKEQNRNERPRHNAAGGRPQRAGTGQPRQNSPQGDAAKYNTRGVPGPDAFDRVPKRKPPNLPGQESEPVTRPPAGQAPQAPSVQKRPPREKHTEKKEAEVAKKEKRERKRRRKESVSPAKRRRNRRIAAITGIVVLVVAGVWFSLSVLFKIERFSLQGESPYTKEEIIEVFGHGPGDNMFGFSVGAAETRIEEQLPYIEEVVIRRRLPGTVVFRVSPAQEAYSIPWEDGWAVLSPNRKVLRLADEPPEGLTVLFGVTGVVVEPGKVLAAGEPGNGFPYSYEEYVALTAPAPPASEPAPVPEEGTPEEGVDAPVDAEAEAVPEGGAPEAGQAEPPAEGGQEDGVPAAGEEEGAPLEDDPSQAAAGEEVPEQAPAEQEPAEAEPPDPTDLSLLADLLAALSASGLESINWVDVSDPLHLRFRWEDRITVELGARNNLAEKFKFITVLLLDPEKSQVTPGDRGVLDVSGYPDTTDRVWLRPE